MVYVGMVNLYLITQPPPQRYKGSHSDRMVKRLISLNNLMYQIIIILIIRLLDLVSLLAPYALAYD